MPSSSSPPHSNSRAHTAGLAAARRARAAGASAFDATLIAIDVAFGPIGHNEHFKNRVRAILQPGRIDEFHARYGRRLLELPPSIEAAAERCAEFLRAERIMFARSVYRPRPRLPVMVLSELALILRLVRRYHRAHFARLHAAIRHAGPIREAAE